jgi:hypothetical protein
MGRMTICRGWSSRIPESLSTTCASRGCMRISGRGLSYNYFRDYDPTWMDGPRFMTRELIQKIRRRLQELSDNAAATSDSKFSPVAFYLQGALDAVVDLETRRYLLTLLAGEYSRLELRCAGQIRLASSSRVIALWLRSDAIVGSLGSDTSSSGSVFGSVANSQSGRVRPLGSAAS